MRTAHELALHLNANPQAYAAYKIAELARIEAEIVSARIAGYEARHRGDFSGECAADGRLSGLIQRRRNLQDAA